MNIGDFAKVEQCKYSDSKYTNSLKKDLGSLGESIQDIYVNENKSTKEKTKVKTKDAYNKLDLDYNEIKCDKNKKMESNNKVIGKVDTSPSSNNLDVSRYCSSSLSHFIKCKLKMLLI